jgi:hypothetical protein
VINDNANELIPFLCIFKLPRESWTNWIRGEEWDQKIPIRSSPKLLSPSPLDIQLTALFMGQRE